MIVRIIPGKKKKNRDAWLAAILLWLEFLDVSCLINTSMIILQLSSLHNTQARKGVDTRVLSKIIEEAMVEHYAVECFHMDAYAWYMSSQQKNTMHLHVL